jgi:hypothetical protein
VTTLSQCLQAMHQLYKANPVAAVRGQGFIKELHRLLADELTDRLTPAATRAGVRVVEEARLLGSHKPKDVDVAVIDKNNGPLVIVGVRSQMSSVGKNALNYYEGIVGECISLQDRFPMSSIGYVYLMPLRPIMQGREAEIINHPRYSRMYEAITGRTGQDYKSIRGIYDEFAYMVVDFDKDPPELRDDIVRSGVPNSDLRIDTFVDRITAKFNARHLFVDYFTPGAAPGPPPATL